jgi:DegV family protein with EDD domain
LTVKIITDSTADLGPEIANKFGITVVPLNVHFGTETYRDSIDITNDDFYQRLMQGDVFPTTSSPSPGIFAETYDRLAQQTNEILAITISSKLSASYKAASRGREMRKQTECRIEVIDSGTAIVGLGLIAIAAAKATAKGMSLDEVIEATHSAMTRVDFRMAFDTLEYLKKGGRIGAAQAFLGSILKVNPILTIRNGMTEGVTKVRSRAKVMDYLYEFAMEFPDVEAIAIEDATTPDEVDMLVERLSIRFNPENILRMKVGPVIGTHVGPHVLSLGILAGGQTHQRENTRLRPDK